MLLLLVVGVGLVHSLAVDWKNKTLFKIEKGLLFLK